MTSRGRLTHSWGWSLAGYLTTLGTILISNMSAVAQILPDSTLGEESSTVTPNVLIRGIVSDRINGGAIRGANLFHSFEQFSINEGRGAYFSNPMGIDNIFSRVTGNNPSNILGRIGVLGNANLFLINPNGILFGTNASLDIQGSFAGTTANAIQFGEGIFFSTTNPEVASPLLTVNPSAFLFNQIPTGNIVSNSVAPSPRASGFLGLYVPYGENITLLGGNISINGGGVGAGLNAFGGRVEIGAVAGAGTVGLKPDGSLSFPSNLSLADVSLFGSFIGVAGGNSGNVAINARNLEILGNSNILAGILPTIGGIDSQAGDITLNATGTLQIEERSRVENIVFTDALGNSGDIRITAGSLSLTDRARLDATTFGRGNGGDIVIETRDRVSLDNRAAIFNDVEDAGKGTGGNIRISTGSLSVTNGAFITASTDGQGDVGNITIEALDRVSLGRDARIRNGVEEDGIGNGGRIHINTRSLSLTDRASISAFNIEQGNAGDLLVDAEEQVSLDKGAGIFNFAIIGNGGDIRISTKSLSIADNSRLEANTFRQGNTGNILIEADDRVALKNDAKIFNASPDGIGNGGDIRISTELLSVADDAALGTNTSGQGNAGDILIDASTISLDGGNISSEVQKLATGSGGNIYVHAHSLTATNLSTIQTVTLGQGNAGNTIINASDRIVFQGGSEDGLRSGVVSQAGKDAVGSGGDIEITTGSLTMIDKAGIATGTFGRSQAGNVIINARDNVSLDNASNIFSAVNPNAEGRGGDINITTGSLSLTNGSQLDASTFGLGSSGNITVTARDRVLLDGINSKYPDRSSTIFTEVFRGAEGDAGNIQIFTGSLILTNGGQLDAKTRGQGNAGNLYINARDTVLFDGTSETGKPTRALSSVDEGAVGRGGNIEITTGSLRLDNGAQLLANTLSKGNAGNVTINARDTVLLNGVSRNGISSAIFSDTRTRSEGQGGTIAINTSSLRVANGAVINARTANSSLGGNIIINANIFELVNGGQAITTTLNSGSAGNITLNVKDKIILSGSDPNFLERRNQFLNQVTNEGNGESGLFANTRLNSTGNGGKINLQTRLLSLSDRAQISARSLGSGTAGDVTITADESVTLTNSDITTSAQQASGGAISLTAKTMRLYGDSDIRTNVENGINNGGNITLKANSIIAFDDSDILAFARDGRGGNVFLDTPAFFGENYQPAPVGTNPDTLDGNDRVDINASGDISSGIISTPDTSFVQNNLSELSQTPIDTNALIANSCIARNSNKLEGSFTITGLGGLPNRPGDVSISTYSTGDVRSVTRDSASNLWQKGDPIIEPQGVYKLASGQLVLSRECR
ncbi:hypothetical protein WA1_05585 [Scytonema hofmannii PCC 7110]|uniref:Filamentous haemagglutinin FhaB/tRNA nuclease CdiA-like TPS domain-containing protein n=1 Tax=Scytonema hofmannii PCC 7110 TaxID=128403 RepID=A0A139WTT4_9CYAN|nr:filamentous hemagglutinin N-terminal domain-containing protein [Scytonema hofmannii]KYC35841.1 hypothetical protein WA1_05585 [Scytonema hofmannii PCC 7110]